MYLDIEMLSVSDVTVLKMQPWFAKVLTTAKTRKTRISAPSRAPTLLKKNSLQLYRIRRIERDHKKWQNALGLGNKRGHEEWSTVF